MTILLVNFSATVLDDLPSSILTILKRGFTICVKPSNTTLITIIALGNVYCIYVISVFGTIREALKSVQNLMLICGIIFFLALLPGRVTHKQ